MEFRVLGPVEVSSGGRPLQLGGAHQRALLGFLLLHANEVVSADRLLDELWAVPPGGGVAAVRTQVSRLRKQLGDRIVTSGRGYELRVEPGELDLDRFRTLLAEAGTLSEPGRRSELLREADRLWRGDALTGLDAPFAESDAAALTELRLAALEDRIEADLDRGRHGELVSELSTLVVRHPLRERLRGQLIVALYRSGRQADALEAYRDAKRTLDEELGLEPSPALRELERAILTHDESLAATAVVDDRGSSEPPPPDAPPSPSRRTWVLVAGTCASLGLAGASVALALSRGHGSAHEPPAAAASLPAHHVAKQAPRKHVHHAVVVKRAVRKSKPTVQVVSRPPTTIVETTLASAPLPATTHPTVTIPRHTAKPAPPPKPVTVSDAFDNDYVDPTIWHSITTGGDVAIAEQDGQLQLTVGPGAVPGGQYNQIDVHVGTQCAWPGNFDARVDYTLLEWPANDNITVGLNAIYASAEVMRVSSSQWGDEYGSWVIPSNGSVSLPDTSGSMRITRVNGVETTYFMHGGTWRKLASATQGGAAVFGLQASSDGQHAFGGQEVKVGFDNFTVTGVDPTCAPGAQPGG
jgi:DNA-binding SARP family transcriptional activator